MKKNNLRKKKSPQEIQDEAFRKMPAAKKIRLVSELSSFCLKLNSLNENIKPRKASYRNS
ncbi:hypothetical protein KKC00_01190 [Patescibacteria group bacterium]|nr:hypothetical protein [Patescibacteria group bacterium]